MTWMRVAAYPCGGRILLRPDCCFVDHAFMFAEGRYWVKGERLWIFFLAARDRFAEGFRRRT